MATNIITQNPFSATGVRPGQWFLTSSEDYATLIAPGYLNSVSSAGLEFQPNDIIFAQYNDGANFGMFIVTVDNGVYTMNVYSPNSNSFIFQHVQFVAKGGSDLNAGTSIGLPKLTIQAAINALNLSPSVTGVVFVLDDGNYQENLIISYGVQIYAPSASITASNLNPTVTINDTGINTVTNITCAQLANFGAGLCVNLLGAQSNLFLYAKIVQGDMHIEGGFIDGNVAQVASNVHVTSTGQFAPNIINAIFFTLTFDLGATIAGNIQSITGPGVSNNNIYGNQTFINHVTYQIDPSTETAGRTVAASDSNTRIVYNNPVTGDYTLPQTSDVAIPIGTQITFVQLGIGAISFIAGTGVTIISNQPLPAGTNGAGAVVYAWKYTDTIWIVSGDLASVGP